MITLIALALCTLPTQPTLELEPVVLVPYAPTFEPGTVALVPYAPAVVAADEMPSLGYTYIEANYVRTDSDALNDHLDGWEITGSIGLPLNFFLQATGSRQSADADVTSYKAGLGWHIGLTNRFDAYGILSYGHITIDNSTIDSSDDGPAGEIGARLMLTKSIEVNARARWADVHESDSGLGAGARFYLTQSLSLGANYDEFGDDQTATAGLRFDF